MPAECPELALAPVESMPVAPGPRPPLLARARAVFGATAGRAARSASEHAAHHGPGLFGSTWDLHRGLDVREGWPADATLGEWIEGWLQPAAGGAGASLSAT
jgi:hypothetical protein